MSALRAVSTILRASPGLDVEKGAELDPVGVKGIAMNPVRLVKQVVEGLLEQAQDLFQDPVMPRCGRSGRMAFRQRIHHHGCLNDS
jgi:hypothetical protein